MCWIEESNRPQHLYGGFVAGVLLSVLFAAGLAIGMEFKDKLNGGKFDWLDIAATMIGGVAGQVVQIVIISMSSLCIHSTSFWAYLPLSCFLCAVAGVCATFLQKVYTILSSK